ncbi:flavodoxin family protein [Candidatus Margulisiibacteriota bacterium]
MNTLIVYYSRTGTNEKLALEAGERLMAQVEKLIDKNKREGFFSFLRCGFDAARKKLTKLAPLTNDPKDFELVVLATPLWAGSLPPAARTFLAEQRNKLNKLALISISGIGAGNKKVMADIEKTLAKKPAAALLLTRKEFADKSYQAKLKTFLSSLPS